MHKFWAKRCNFGDLIVNIIYLENKQFWQGDQNDKDEDFLLFGGLFGCGQGMTSKEAKTPILLRFVNFGTLDKNDFLW